MPGKGKKCIKCNKTRASCAKEGEKPIYCGKCKEEGMTNVTRKKCEECNKVVPTFGYEGQEKHTHCLKCKKDGMINIRSDMCKKCNKVQASYGNKNGKAEYCISCKETNMVDVKSNKCIICKNKQPVFALKDKKATHCGDCKSEDMIDVKSRMCKECKIKNPIYGLPGTTNTHCATCKLEGMIDLKNIKCIECKETQATFAIKKGERATHCKKCKPSTYIDVKHKLCKSDNCLIRTNKEVFEGYCNWCFQHLYPENPIVKLMHGKTYETEVASHLLNKDASFKHDAPMFIGGCDCSVRRRVDFWKIIGNTILAIEVDENQHKSYETDYEEIRYNDLFMAFSGKWVFIRFNPNNYKDKKGKIVRKALKEKIEVLLEEIDIQTYRITQEKNEDLLEIHRLFFDEL